MKAEKLYEKLEEFITPEMSDDWYEQMDSIKDFISDNYKRSMGLVCDFAKEINKVYTAVFPSKKVMQKILDSNIEDAMLFVHHPATWDIRKDPNVFTQMNRELLQKFKERRISIYNLHVPLDNYGEYSTSVTLAKALNIEPEEAFAPYYGALCGVFGKTELDNIDDLKKVFESAVGHEVSLYNYGDNKIKDNYTAVIAGGGNDLEMLKEIKAKGVNTFITGITVKNDHSAKAHEFAEENKINILGGTHYSTETFACKTMIKYFENLGLQAEFVEDKPVVEDM